MIKIDVEGAEMLVLKGAHEVLNSQEKPVLVIEVEDNWMKSFEYSRNDLQAQLLLYGYKLYQLDKKTLKLSQLKSIGSLTEMELFCLGEFHAKRFKDILY